MMKRRVCSYDMFAVPDPSFVLKAGLPGQPQNCYCGEGIQVGNNSFSGSSHCPGGIRRTFRLISRAGRILLPVFLCHEITLPIS